jgi:malate synthase
MKGKNQIDNLRSDVEVTEADLLAVPGGTRTEDGLRHNIRVGVQYIEAWLGGQGCVPLYNLMEDAATAEISRAQVWQWQRNGAQLEGGQRVTPELLTRLIAEEMLRVRAELGDARYDEGHFPEAIELFGRLSLAERFEEFLTLPAYQQLLTHESPPQ